MEAHLIALTNAETAASHRQTSAEIVKSRRGGFEFTNGCLIAEDARKLYEPPTFIRALTLWFPNWDNRPPRNLRGSDYGTTSGLTWTFGQAFGLHPRRCNSQRKPAGGAHEGRI